MTENHEKRLYHSLHTARGFPLWVWLTGFAYMVLAGNFLSHNYQAWALTAGWFSIGILCILNYSSCGRYHCKITGPAFIGIGILTMFNTVGAITLQNWIIGMLLPALALTIGFGLESRYRSTEGTPAFLWLHLICNALSCLRKYRNMR